MTIQSSNIDDLLMAETNKRLPSAPESTVPVDDAVLDEVIESEAEEIQTSGNEDAETKADEGQENVAAKDESDVDDYGNEKPAAKTYTEDEVNERINQAVRERLARFERNSQQPNQQYVQQQVEQNFQHNPDSDDSWQQQLEKFVEQTVLGMSQKQAQQAQLLKEQQVQAEFEQKFQKGMSRFNNYEEVVGAQPITDAMVLASRAMKDPAAFFYAASTRAPQELQRIAGIQDQYAQMVEIGKLEERMKVTKPATKAPKPVSRTHEDAAMPHKTEKEPTIEDLIAKAEAKKRALYNQRRR